MLSGVKKNKGIINERNRLMNNTEDKTLCALQEEGYVESHTEDFKKLIQPAHFFCKNCGRSAVRSENLCNSEDLS
jgi:hypothetical protein